MRRTLIKNARMINEGRQLDRDLLIEGEYIAKIDRSLSDSTASVVDLNGSLLFPGLIDDQVHFREPGLTHKGDIASESRAAIAGGITSFMEQPNTLPQTTTIARLEEKYNMAAKTSWANYAFLLGGTNDNLEEIKRLDKHACPGIKLFLGSSTGNMLVDDEQALEAIFRNTELVISAHCEDEKTISLNLTRFMARYGDDIPVHHHPDIRSETACHLSSSRAIALAKRTGARLHVFHVSTAAETGLFGNDTPLELKKITAEACIHHLWFTDRDYENKGNLIKWNPAIKTAEDRKALWEAVLDGRIDVVATDHAPHTLEEKNRAYTRAPSGGPLVQHALPAMLQKHTEGMISLEKIAEKMCHNPAILFEVEKRGFIREGFFADLTVANLKRPWTVTSENIAYKCGWSPFEGFTFGAAVTHTFVNGLLAYAGGVFSKERRAKRLTYKRAS